MGVRHPCCEPCEFVNGEMICDCDPDSECHQVNLEEPEGQWGRGSGKYADRKERHKKHWASRRGRGRGDDYPGRRDDNNNNRRGGGGGGGLGGVGLTCTPTHSRSRDRRAAIRHYGLRKRAAGQYSCVPRYTSLELRYRAPIRRPRTVVDYKNASM